ncbi:hypothetical protein KC298_15250, partial [Listeria monocytogenes]|uniref:hypothetical protein n=1 Tax=Listeria monocytogenes TaxID=1639 RepID=UPI001F596F88
SFTAETMNKIIFASFVLALYLAVGHGLQCYELTLGVWNVGITTKKTCDAGQLCFSGLGKAGGFVDLKMKGCLEFSKCNKTESTTF